MKSFRGYDREHLTQAQIDEAWPELKKFLFDACSAILENHMDRAYWLETEEQRAEKRRRSKELRALKAEVRNLGKNH